MTAESTEAKRNKPDGDDHDGKLVTITVDGKTTQIARGKYIVSDLKQELSVAAELEMDVFEKGEFVPLDDSATFHLKGGEVFIGHQRRGGSS